MTRDECMKAVSAAFNGAEVWAVVGFWDIKIVTMPKRTLVLSAAWVEENIQSVGERQIGMSSDEFQAQLECMADHQWSREADGNLIAMLCHNGR